jgi:hypothetical protein
MPILTKGSGKNCLFFLKESMFYEITTNKAFCKQRIIINFIKINKEVDYQLDKRLEVTIKKENINT